MEKFPELNKNEVALPRAQNSTGHVLDENCKLKLNGAQKVYTVFDCLDLALQYADSLIKEQRDLEIVIYGHGQRVIKTITAL